MAILPRDGGTAQVKNAANIRSVIDLLFPQGQIIELRALKTLRGTISGYFGDFGKLADAAARLSGNVPAVYVTLNPVKPDLLARAVNVIKPYAQTTTADADVLSIRWLPIDADPKRPAGISSTEAEHQAAIARVRECRDWLRSLGIDGGILGDSGNGGHCLYEIEGGIDSAKLIKACLAAIGERFSDNVVSIDQTTFNPARIWKLYGTLACKGDSTADRPHRMAAVIHSPEPRPLVSVEALEKLAALAPKPPERPVQVNGTNFPPFDLDQFLSRHSITVKREDPWKDGRRLILDVCPFNPDHSHGEAVVTQGGGGGIGFRCQHNGCSGYRWADLREKFEPGYRDGKKPPESAGSGAPAEPQRRQQQEFWPTPITVKELRAASEAGFTWLWDQAVPLGAVSMIAGEPRVGKSTLALNLAVAISRGAPFLGRKTKPAQCFYVSIDNNADDMKLSIDRMGVGDDEKIRFHLGQVPDQATEWLIEMIKSIQAKFVVVDTYQRFFSIVDINSSECVPKMSPMDFAVKELGFHLMYLHHASAKPGREAHKLAGFMGNTTIKGMCPYYFEYIRVGEGQHRVLMSDLRNGRQFDDVYVKIDPRTGWGVNGGTVEDAFIEDASERIVELLEAQETATEPEIRDGISGRGIVVSKALRKLYNSDAVCRIGAGRRGDPFRYSLPADIRHPLSLPLYGNGTPGRETVLPSQVTENKEEDSLPGVSGRAGTRNISPGESGRESDAPKTDPKADWSKAR